MHKHRKLGRIMWCFIVKGMHSFVCYSSFFSRVLSWEDESFRSCHQAMNLWKKFRRSNEAAQIKSNSMFCQIGILLCGSKEKTQRSTSCMALLSRQWLMENCQGAGQGFKAWPSMPRRKGRSWNAQEPCKHLVFPVLPTVSLCPCVSDRKDEGIWSKAAVRFWSGKRNRRQD